jgi:TolB-like protein
MHEPSSSGVSSAARQAPGSRTVWVRIKEHKVLQWTLAYLGAALALAHGQELLAHNFHWSPIVGQVLIGLLIVGFPLAIALAWYHGHKGLTRISAGELMVISLLLVIGAGVLIALVRSAGEPGSNSVTSEPASSRAATPPAASVAVVPFANLTGDPAKEYIGDGMAEELINALAEVPGLKVPARTSSFAYKGRNVDIRQIASDLGVAKIVEGSVRSAGERLRVTAQLVDARSGYHLWTHTYDKQSADIFQLQDELANSIVQALLGKIDAARLTGTRPMSPPTQNVDAYRLYQQARSIQINEAGSRTKLALMDQALALDPQFTRALAYRALVRLSFIINGYSLPNALEDAERDARQAAALQPQSPEVLGVLGTIDSLRGNWGQAEANLRADLDSAPVDARARGIGYAMFFLGSTGRLRKALAEARDAYAQAPGDAEVVKNLARIHSYLGNDAEAVRLADLAVQLGAATTNVPQLPFISANAARRGARYAEAARYAISGLPEDLRGAGGDGVMRTVYAALADPAKKASASKALRDFVDKIGTAGIPPASRHEFITLFTLLGALDESYRFANASLDEFIRSGVIGAPWGDLWTPEMRPFRTDPRFQAFVTRLKLVDYWKQSGPPDDCTLRGDTLVCR